ncbi:choice-of-anchor A family protein [Tundrisphaera sp. TA3]|uniref:choice-of-anchor A family protein n=1 Tax=Tundrisphaera sp. TA3 TaxID=3435775 RepID=UPI003EC00878
MNRIQWVVLAAMITASPTSQAGIVNLGTANGYNVFVLGDNTQSNTRSEGKVAVGGNANFGGNYSVASALSASGTNLVVGKNYSNTYGSVNGSVVVGGTATINGPTINGNLNANGDVKLSGYGTISGALGYGGSLSNPNTVIGGTVAHGTTSLPVAFDAEKTYLTSLSSELSKTIGNTYGNGVTYQYGGLTLTGTASDVNVFTIKGSDLASTNNMKINATAGSTVVINVDGASDQIQNFGFTLTGVDRQRVLFNFHQATSLTLSGVGIQGSILAPNAAISFNNSTIDGTIVGRSISGNGAANNFSFAGDLSALVGPTVTPGVVPEPATILSTVIGLALIGGASHHQRRRTA